MRTRMSILAVLLVLALCACKSDRERAAETLAAFTEAVVIHRAPYHAYALLDAADKKHLSVEAWSSGFEEREQLFPAGTAITVGDVTIKRDVAEASVKITPPAGEAETRKYVLRREGTKWRIWLGLSDLETMRTTLEEAQRLAEDGAVEQAREKVEAVAAKGFAASIPDVIEREVLVLRQRLGNQERFAELDKRFTEAMRADLDAMRKEYDALAEQVGPDDEAFFGRLESLKDEIVKRERQQAMEQFQFDGVKARQFRDAWGVAQEVRFKATNNTGRPLSRLTVRLELINEGSDTAVGSIVWQLIEDGGSLLPNKSVNVKREVESAPEAWTGQQVQVKVDDLAFADGGANDAG